MVGPHLTVQTWDTARLELQPRTVAVRHGQAMFDVGKIDAGEETIKVSVSHGTIEVLGTRFTVAQDEQGGTVDLFEGRIRFHHVPADGRAPVDIHPGQRYAWGDRAAPEPLQPEDPKPSPISSSSPMTMRTKPAQPAKHSRHVRKPKQPDADAIIAEVTALRGAGRYDAAARRLRQALQLHWDRRNRPGPQLRAGSDPRATSRRRPGCVQTLGEAPAKVSRGALRRRGRDLAETLRIPSGLVVVGEVLAGAAAPVVLTRALALRAQGDPGHQLQPAHRIGSSHCSQTPKSSGSSRHAGPAPR